MTILKIIGDKISPCRTPRLYPQTHKRRGPHQETRAAVHRRIALPKTTPILLDRNAHPIAVLRQCGAALVALAGLLERGMTTEPDPELVPLEVIARRYSVTVRAVRSARRRGVLPAVKVGRAWMVRPADAAALYAPKVAALPTKRPRLVVSEAQRERDQLARAGIRVGGRS